MYQSKWAPKPAEEQSSNDVRPSTSLSASAPSFSPAPPTPVAEPSSIDTFTQTGPSENDLFDDVIPVDDSMRVRSEEDLFSDDFTPVAQPVVEQRPQQASRSRGNGVRGRGRGRGRGGIEAQHEPNVDLTTPAASLNGDVQPQLQPNVPENAPTGPKHTPTPSVRGDRHATGGVRKPKLSEDELAARISRISIRNAELHAAHERAEADAASFAARETAAKTQAAQRQKEERQNRQQMMGERERNRMRKLKAVEGREWDAEKKEEDFERGGRFDKKGGFAGDKGEEYSDGREYLYKEPQTSNRGGRGGRGASTAPARPPKQEEFPVLPGAAAKDSTVQGPAQAESGSANADGKSSWADQVEVAIA